MPAPSTVATVEFHTGVPETLEFACRLLRKAHRQGASVLCLAPAGQLEALDKRLWTFVERDFLPHVRMAGASQRVLQRTPIWLASAWEATEAPRDVVLNLGGVLPQVPMTTTCAAGAPRVIEVVGLDADEAERGRALWRQYKAAGFAIVHHAFGATRGE